MKKNKILKIIVTELLEQRERLISNLDDLNYNENNWERKKNGLEISITKIDDELRGYISQCEVISSDLFTEIKRTSG